MQPSLGQLIQIIRTLAHDYDFVRVVLASVPSKLQDHTPSWLELGRVGLARLQSGYNLSSLSRLQIDPAIPTNRSPRILL